MKFIITVLCCIFSFTAIADRVPGFIKPGYVYVYRMMDTRGLRAFKVLRVMDDWIYVKHYRKRDEFVQYFWFSLDNKNIKYIVQCTDSRMHESERTLCDRITIK